MYFLSSLFQNRIVSMPKRKKNINLLPKTKFEKSILGKVFLWSLQTGKYFFFITQFIVIAAFISRFALDNKLADLNESINEKQLIAESLKETEKEINFLNQRLIIIKTLEKNQLHPAEVLTTISKSTPSDIYFTEFSQNSQQVNIEASALSNASLAGFLSQLQEEELFKEITLSSLTIKGTESSEIEFSLTAALEQQ